MQPPGDSDVGKFVQFADRLKRDLQRVTDQRDQHQADLEELDELDRSLQRLDQVRAAQSSHAMPAAAAPRAGRWR
jgi:hypothetical protein